MTIYLDYSAATPVLPEVLKEMQPYFSEIYANPSSIHSPGKQARKAIENARSKIASIIGSEPSEIIFCSSGTESINLAIKGILRASQKKHIITSKIEHKAVLEACRYLEKYENCKVTYLDVDKYGLVSLEDIEKAITKDTCLITIHHANNEIGTIQPIKEIAEMANKYKIPLHIDGCQSGLLDLKEKLGVTLATLNSSKIYGPKGAALLFIKRGTKIHPLLHGGGQEFNLRSSTENILAIVGFAKALELIQKSREEESERLTKLRDYLIKELLKIPDSKLNGHPTQRLPNNINISFKDIDEDSLLLHLDEQQIYVSTSSACTAKSIEPSHVIKALAPQKEYLYGNLRISLGIFTTKEDVEKVAQILPSIIEKLRKHKN